MSALVGFAALSAACNDDTTAPADSLGELDVGTARAAKDAPGSRRPRPANPLHGVERMR